MIIRASSGLMSRCRCLADAYYLVKKYEKKPRLVIIWSVDQVCPVKYERIFSKKQFNDIKIRVINLNGQYNGVRNLLRKGKVIAVLKELIRRVVERFILGYYKKRYDYIRYKTDIEFNDCEDYRNSLTISWENVLNKIKNGGKELFVDDYQSIMYPHIYEEASVRVQKIIFCEAIVSKVQDIIKKYRNSIVGIHIRGTDHETAKKLSPVELFIDKMNKEINDDPDVMFFLATDEKDIETRLKTLYGKRIIAYDDKNFLRASTEGLLDGIVDMLCLASCVKIYGSYGSQFSGFAAEYGHIQKTDIVRNEGEYERS